MRLASGWCDWSCRRTPVPVMLGIGKLAAGAEDYYLNIAAGIEDYYLGVSTPGQWIASSQPLLGLDGEIDPDALRSVFAGLDPATGSPLLRSANRSVMAFDLTFKADKSVSLLHAFSASGIAATIEAAHGAAVGSAMGRRNPGRRSSDHARRATRGSPRSQPTRTHRSRTSP